MLLLGIRIVHPVQEITIQLTAFLSGGSWHQCRNVLLNNQHVPILSSYFFILFFACYELSFYEHY